MVTRYHLRGNGKMLWSNTALPVDREATEAMRRGTYDRVLRNLRRNQRRLAAQLVARKESAGDETRATLAGRIIAKEKDVA